MTMLWVTSLLAPAAMVAIVVAEPTDCPPASRICETTVAFLLCTDAISIAGLIAAFGANSCRYVSPVCGDASMMMPAEDPLRPDRHDPAMLPVWFSSVSSPKYQTLPATSWAK